MNSKSFQQYLNEDIYANALRKKLTPEEIKRIDSFVDSEGEEWDDLEGDLYDKLMDFFADEMPYGVMKARTGDPMEWMYDKFISMGFGTRVK